MLAVFWPILIYHTLQRALCYEDTLSNALPALLKGKEQISPRTGGESYCFQNLCNLLFIEYVHYTQYNSVLYSGFSVRISVSPELLVFNTTNILYEQSLKITLSSIKRVNLAHGKRLVKSLILWPLTPQEGSGAKQTEEENFAHCHFPFANLDLTEVFLLPRSMSLFLALPCPPPLWLQELDDVFLSACWNQSPMCTRLKETGTKPLGSVMKLPRAQAFSRAGAQTCSDGAGGPVQRLLLGSILTTRAARDWPAAHLSLLVSFPMARALSAMNSKTLAHSHLRCSPLGKKMCIF